MRASPFFVLALFSALGPGVALLGQDMEADELIAAYEKSLVVAANLEFDLVERLFVQGGKYPTEKCKSLRRAACRHDGKRWSVKSATFSGDDAGQDPRTAQSRSEYVLTDKHRFDLDEGSGQFVIRARLADAVKNTSPRFTPIGKAKLLFGFFDGGQEENLPDFLRKFSPTVEKQSPTDEGLRLLISRGSFGEYRVWLDPQAGFSLRKLEIRKLAGDLLGRSTVGESKTGGDMPDAYMSRYADDVDQVQVEKFGERWLITSFESRTVFGYADGRGRKGDRSEWHCHA